MRKNKAKIAKVRPSLAPELSDVATFNQKNTAQKTQIKDSAPQLSREDENILIDFCATIKDQEEVTFECWSESHTKLDLIIPVFITIPEAKEGLTKQLFFTRTISEHNSPIKTITKIKTSCEIVIAPGVASGAKILKKGLGDSDGRQTGDLIITICFK